MKVSTALFSSAVLANMALAQSSSSAAAPSASASGGMSSNSSSSDYLTQVLGALNSAGLTSLVGVASAIANTSEGMMLLGSLANGNKTVFAPNNDAFSAVPSDVSQNTTLLTQILSYHILNNTYSGEGIATTPNHTIARTLLNGGEFRLPGNKSAPLVLERASMNDTSFRIVQSNLTNASNPVSAANLQVYVIDTVLSLPSNISTVATAAVPQLAGVIEQAGLLEPLEQAVGITVFAPTDSALGAVMSQLGQFNSTQLQTLLANHVINGTAAYSTDLGSGNYTSAAGEPFTFMRNGTGVFVTSGNSTAEIVTPDIIINNGVVHLINGVLANTMSNPAAAESYYTSATGAAATMTEPTGAITQTSQPASSGSSKPSGAAGRKSPISVSASMVGGAVGVLLAVAGGAFTLL